jgi:hypothetical protein
VVWRTGLARAERVLCSRELGDQSVVRLALLALKALVRAARGSHLLTKVRELLAAVALRRHLGAEHVELAQERLRARGVAGVQDIGSHMGRQAMLARGLPRVVRLAWPQGPSIRGCSQSTHYCVVICDGLMPGRHLLTRVRVEVHAPTSGFQLWTRF